MFFKSKISYVIDNVFYNLITYNDYCLCSIDFEVWKFIPHMKYTYIIRKYIKWYEFISIVVLIFIEKESEF